MAGIWQMGKVTSPNVWDMGSVGAFSGSLSITSVGGDNIVVNGETLVPVVGTLLNTVTSAVVETSDSTYSVDVTASYSAASAESATFTHALGNTPLSTASYQLRLKLSDGITTVTRNISVEPASGLQVTELAGTLVTTDPESVFAPYTGPAPAVGDQYTVPLLSTEGGTILPNSDSTFSIDYSALPSIPATDSFAVTWWSDNGTTGRVWSSGTVNVSRATPVVESVTVPAAGVYGRGDTLVFDVEWATIVTVTGTPQLSLTLGTETVLANYVSGSGSSTTTFQATVPSLDAATGSLSVDSLGLNGGTIQDSGGTNATLTLNGVASTAGVSIDTTGPVVVTVSVPANGTYFQDDVMAFTVNWNEAIFVTGTPRLALSIGGTTRYANYSSQPGSAALRFTYTVQAGDLDTNGILLITLELNGGTIKDAAANNAATALNGVSSTTGVLVDAEQAVMTSITPPASATYDMAEALTFTVNYSEAITVTGTPRLALDIGGVTEYASYVSGTGTSALVFTYTIANTNLYDMDGVTVSALEANGGTLKNSVGATADLTLVGTTTFTGVFVDTATPAGTITFGAETVTGTTISLPFVYSASDATGFEYRVDAGAWVAFTASPASITGLTSATTYAVDVRPTNSFGAGDTFSTSVTTATVAAPPAGTVAIGSVTTTTTTASVAFTYSASDQTGFEYRVDSGTWIGIAASPVSLTGLTTGTAYFVEVRAVNVDGASSAASVVVNTDSVNTPQGVITFGTATVTDTLASIPFTYDLSDQTGFEYRIDGGTWFNIAASPVSLAGLTPDTPYAIDVRAVNAEGPGTTYSTAITTAALTPPVGTITFGTATLSQTTASIPFTYSASDQDYFEYRLDGGTWLVVTNPIGLSGLNPEQSYTLEVRAVNGDGEGTVAITTVTTLAEQSSTVGGVSGLYDFNLQVDEIIEDAYERIGKEAVSGYDLRTARRSLNLMLTEWVNKDITLWTAERVSIACVAGQAEYDLRARDVDVMEVALRTSGADMVLSRVSWDQSMYTSDKDQAGRPIQYKFDRQITPKLVLWPVPDSSSYSLQVDVFKYIQDAGAYFNVIGAPRRFLPAMVAGLAFYLAEKRAPALVAQKKALYDEALEEALSADEEVKSFVVRPSRSGYRRR